MNRKIIVLLIIAVAVFMAVVQEAASRQSYLVNFEQKYPWTIDSRIGTCILCHFENPQNNTFAWNPYGEDFRKSGNFSLIESIDSDNDGYTNIEELKDLTFPGDPNDKPGSLKPDITTVIPTPSQPIAVQTTAIEKTPGFDVLLTVFALLVIYSGKEKT